MNELLALIPDTPLVVYTVLFEFAWAGEEYFRRTKNDLNNQFLFILLVVFLAAVGAQILHIDQIVGAFLVGLAVNDVVGRSPVAATVVGVQAGLLPKSRWGLCWPDMKVANWLLFLLRRLDLI